MNERLEELITLAALGELTEDERRELDAAAAADPAVAAELAAELETAAGLADVASVAAPAGLRGRVLDAIADTEQEPRPGQDVDPAVPGSVTPISEARRDPSRRSAVAILSAAAAVLIVAGAGWLALSGDDADPVEEVATASDSVERAFEGELGGSLVLFHSATEGAVALEGDSIPRPPTGRVYVLWTITDDGATPVGEFLPDDEGRVEVRLDGVDPTGAQLGVTEEPEGGSEVPTLPIRATA